MKEIKNMRCNYANLVSDEIGLSASKARAVMDLLNAVRGAAGGAVEKAVKEANAILKKERVYATIGLKGSGGFKIEADPDKDELDLADEEEDDDGPGEDDDEDSDDEDEDYDDPEDSDEEDEEDDPRDVALVERMQKRWGIGENRAWKLLEKATDKIEDGGKKPTDDRVMAMVGTWLDKWAKENGKGEVGSSGPNSDRERVPAKERGGSRLTANGLETAAAAARKFNLSADQATALVQKAIRAISNDTSESEEGGIPDRENILEWIGKHLRKEGSGGETRGSKRGRRSAA